MSEITSETTNPTTAWTELLDHARNKLTEEQRFHDAAAKAGRKVHGRRIDRRPLWEATIFFATTFVRRPPKVELKTRQEAWDYVVRTACHLTAEEDIFVAIGSILLMKGFLAAPRGDLPENVVEFKARGAA